MLFSSENAPNARRAIQLQNMVWFQTFLNASESVLMLLRNSEKLPSNLRRYCDESTITMSQEYIRPLRTSLITCHVIVIQPRSFNQNRLTSQRYWTPGHTQDYVQTPRSDCRHAKINFSTCGSIRDIAALRAARCKYQNANIKWDCEILNKNIIKIWIFW